MSKNFRASNFVSFLVVSCLLVSSCEKQVNDPSVRQQSINDKDFDAQSRISASSDALLLKESVGLFNSQNQVGEKTKEVKFKGLNGIIPENYPSELVGFTPDDIQNIALSKNGKKNYIVKGIKGETLGDIIDNVYRKYPSFDSFDAKQYKRFFPKLSDEDILKNSETILQFIEKIMAFEIASAFSQLENAEYSLADYVKPKNKNARVSLSAEGFFNGVCTVSIVIT